MVEYRARVSGGVWGSSGGLGVGVTQVERWGAVVSSGVRRGLTRADRQYLTSACSRSGCQAKYCQGTACYLAECAFTCIFILS